MINSNSYEKSNPRGEAPLDDEYRKRTQEEMQRRFIDLQFKRSELEKQLKRVNEVLFSLGREMEEHFSYDQLYK